MGAIPIISSRWVGASQVDFPGVRRVDHTNGTEISAVIAEVARNYEQELQSLQNGRFFNYALSMWGKVRDTADVMIGASYMHFLLHARTLEEEYTASFQMLALLYVYPLCSIDLYVQDVIWFIRHHYAFFELLQHAGYVRIDPFDPTEFPEWQKDPLQSNSFVRIKDLGVLEKFLENHSEEAQVEVEQDGLGAETATSEQISASACGAGGSNHGRDKVVEVLQGSLLVPAWKAVLVVLPINIVFRNPDYLLQQLSSLSENGFNSFGVFKLDLFDAIDNNSPATTEMLHHKHGLIVAPGCELHKVVTLISSIISTAKPAAISHRADSDANTPTMKSPYVSVCSLYHDQISSITSADSNPTEQTVLDVVSGVTRSAAWMTTKIFAESMEFNCTMN